MKKIITSTIFILFILLSIHSYAQKYAVYFRDKNDSPYSVENPGQFLSQRALDRRERHNLDVVTQDLPVNPQYVLILKGMGATVPFTSKWLNCALVSCSQTIINQIKTLSFVSHVVYISPGSYSGKSGEEKIISKFSNKLEKEENFKTVNSKDINEEYLYGQGNGQINQINGIPVHKQGFTGNGILIAVLDAGFQNVSTMQVFNSIYAEERMVFTMDVVTPNGSVYASNTSSHGTNVLSCMAACANNSFVGTAPKALYALIRTEDEETEYLIECYNWVVGMEAADSIGADIINTSLGYSTFDDVSMNYTFSQMDGESTVASYAAKCAVERGIFVTVSQGNGNTYWSQWPWVASPGDATHAATIGAVNANGNIASFSSLGPNALGQPKPNVLAKGVDATVYSTDGSISLADGTSFSSPIACGMYACLIQANPTLHPALLRDIVDKTGSRFPNHDNAYGYGIPNFAAALETVLSITESEHKTYAVHFKNKNNSPYSIDDPLAYLSQRAIDRRNKYNIAITEDDFPVNPSYIEKINLTGAQITNSSRWSNSVLVRADDNMMNLIQKLDFVDKVVYVKPADITLKRYDIHPKWKNEKFDISYITKENYEYGYTFAQIQQLNGVTVHKNGYTGEDVLIAILDGGFRNANKIAGLAHLFESDRIVLEKNVVEPNRSIYDESISNHGTSVLSCMGGYIENEYIGTSPKASFALIRTEDAPTEYLIEEYFWMIGAEAADSIGANMINSSLSYQDFDDPQMSHTYSEMDGKTAISSIAAKMAVERGIFVSASAGNSNGDAFPYVASPADTPEALTVGAVNINGEIAYFSSIGTNGAGDLKPDVVTCGSDAYVILANGNIGMASGTSFSSPITCGMVACIIGAAPDKTPFEIHETVRKSANRYPEHDVAYGYGIPDFGKVLQMLGILSVENHNNRSKLAYYPNPVEDKLYLNHSDKMIKNVEMYDIVGKLIINVPVCAYSTSINVKGFGKGLLFIKVIYDHNESEIIKCVVLQ